MYDTCVITCQMIKTIHLLSSFLSFLSPCNRDRYLNGLDKLQFAAEQIGEMRVTLSELRPQLEASAHETTETMKKIETENISVEKATILVKKDEDMANIQAEIAMNLKTECEADLAEALPALEEALGTTC